MTGPKTIHATCVALNDRAVLLCGASGRGKSALGLILMGMGCTLVADDRTLLERDGAQVMARCPAPIRGMIEARGIGILAAKHVDRAAVVLVADLDQLSDERLPHRRTTTLLGCEIPLIAGIDGPHFGAAMIQILKSGWSVT
ncbi:serine kinase [Yoonia sp.]|uniref:HPr kinase/phosphorylase n=1 Tax=Yoonia sp. TaxID=2212373 RepID=UPI001A08A1F5|nr:serine kinase [Yoonia sp.]MBE0413390.1 serine kinase [Yoonia sp.]